MEKFEETLKKVRDREANWSASEKECLRECINLHLVTVENRGNDICMIDKKKKAWKEIQEGMLSAGYERDIAKLKSQWVRMKVNARKAVTNVKRASIATGNSIPIPEVSAEDSLVGAIIVNELEDDEILMDSDSATEIGCTANIKDQNATGSEDVSKIIYTSPALKKLRGLPNAPSKSSVLSERQRQISKETSNSDKIYKLQKQHLTAQIEHQTRMSKMEDAHTKELHSLRLLQIQRLIDHEDELHTFKLDMFRKGTNQNL